MLDVPLIVRYPGASPRVSEAPAALLDVFPTVLDVLGISAPAGLMGTSLRTLESSGPPRSVFAETWRERKVRGVVRGEFKLIHDRETGQAQLFNLARDPEERENLFAARRGRADSLMAALNGWQASDPYRQRPGPRVEIGDEERERLRSLGYTGN